MVVPVTPKYDIWLRDKDFHRIERLDVWSNLTIIKRFNKTGTWNLEVPAKSRLAQYIDENTGIIIQRDGVTIFSGPGGEEFSESSNSIRAAGTDDNVFLENPVRPIPSQNTGPYSVAYDTQTGQASGILISLVDRNIGPSAPSYWKIPQLTMAADPMIGSTITSRGRFDPLITLLAELASTPIATGLGFQILQSDNLSDTLVFSLYVPQDKHLETVFSVDLHTAQDYNRVHYTPGANYFIVAGGDGFGEERNVVEDGDADSIAAVGRRVAQFVDKRGVVDTGELNQELAQLIAGAITSDVITITPTDVPSIVYGTNYELGDYVTAVVKGIEYARLIREIEIRWDVRRGPIVIPTVADPNGSNDELGARHLRTLEGRISNIERNFNVPTNSIINDMIYQTERWLPGDMKQIAHTTVQAGWLHCQGQILSRSSFIELFSYIGTDWNIGGESGTQFRIPDMRDRVTIGAVGGTISANVGDYGGAMTVNIQHVHTGTSHTHGPGDLRNTSHGHPLSRHDHDSGTYEVNGSTELSTFEVNIQSGSGEVVAQNGHAHALSHVDVSGVSTVGEIEGTGTIFEATGNGNANIDAGATSASGTGNTGTAGSAALSTVQPWAAVHWAIYHGVG